MLDPVQNIALQLCLGAFRTSPTSSLCVEANEPPLELRRKKLVLKYCVRLRASPSNPAHNCIFKPQFKAEFYKKPNQMATLGLRSFPDLHKVGRKILHFTLSQQSLLGYLKDQEWTLASADTFISKFNELRHECFTGFYELFTDGSEEGLKASLAAVCYHSTSSIHVPDRASIFTAELHPIKLALG